MNQEPRDIIRVEGLSKSYPMGFWRRRVQVVFDLSFSVGRNEVVGFLGPNGAGKTTTIKILNRLAFQDAGTVALFGENTGRRAESRRRIGFMPEQPYFYEYLTGEEFLGLCGHLYGMTRREIAARSRELMERVGLEGSGRKAIRKYSKGMMQRLGLAQALLHDPELVILDEPMSGLDPIGRVEVRNLIRELKGSGKTVFFSSHIISDAETLCDRVIILNRGRMMAEGSVEDLMGKEIHHVEMVFSPVPPPDCLAAEPLGPAAVSVRADAVVVRVADVEGANRVMERLRAAGSLLQSCIPVKKRLEDIFVERVGVEGGGGAGHGK